MLGGIEMIEIYFPGEKLNLKIGNEESKWEVLEVDNTRGLVTCQKLHNVKTIIQTFTIERIQELIIDSKALLKNK
jgi:hypothetical protein